MGNLLSERLDELVKKGASRLVDANDEVVGLYAQTALLVLANQNERVKKELTETYKNANGETQRIWRI